MPPIIIRLMRNVAAAVVLMLGAAGQGSSLADSPLDVARILAARYPEHPSMSYIPALSWSGALRLSALAREPKWKERAGQQMQPFIAGEKPAIAEPYQLTSLAGHLALSDLGEVEHLAAATKLANDAADFIVAATPEEIVKFRRAWTDDMFMASSLLSRVSRRSDRHFEGIVGRLLTSYAEKLQRPDGLFIHAVEGPHAWGRGNGFAALGIVEALTYFDDKWSDRPRVLDIYRRHMRALSSHQSDDGSWRQVVDEPTSYRELTVTAMTVAAMARGIRLGWLDKSYRANIDRGWRAVVARIGAAGTVRDVCSGTGAGPTKVYYLNRPVVNGADDRGGAMALLAALEMEELRRQ